MCLYYSANKARTRPVIAEQVKIFIILLTQESVAKALRIYCLWLQLKSWMWKEKQSECNTGNAPHMRNSIFVQDWVSKWANLAPHYKDILVKMLIMNIKYTQFEHNWNKKEGVTH